MKKIERLKTPFLEPERVWKLNEVIDAVNELRAGQELVESFAQTMRTSLQDIVNATSWIKAIEVNEKYGSFHLKALNPSPAPTEEQSKAVQGETNRSKDAE